MQLENTEALGRIEETAAIIIDWVGFEPYSVPKPRGHLVPKYIYLKNKVISSYAKYEQK